jgi:hypothetical protein
VIKKEVSDHIMIGANVVSTITRIIVQVSVPDLGDRMAPALAAMYESLRPVLKGLNLWQVISFSTMVSVLGNRNPSRFSSLCIHEPSQEPV